MLAIGAARMGEGVWMAIDQAVVHEIVRRIVPVATPDRIILFGSAATGKMTRDSDIDLLVVAPGLRNRREEYVRIRQALRGMRYPFDIVPVSTRWFEESKNTIGGIAYPAHKYGKVIYEAGGGSKTEGKRSRPGEESHAEAQRARRQ